MTMTQRSAAGRGESAAHVRHSREPAYDRILSRIEGVAERGGDIGPLVNTLFSRAAHLADPTFRSDWDRIHRAFYGARYSERVFGGEALRHQELGAILALLYRRGLLEERRLMDHG
ncbi:MAG: hypothetical protein ACYDDF_12535 [Thermoplasmatota archaeon]